MTTDSPVTIAHDVLQLGPVQVSFQRTLRLPETGLHALPPGLGRFRLRRVADYPDTAPADWLERGGVMLPVYQREAMWLSFVSSEPAALQVAIGKICAISGTAWREKLRHEPQNYVALPRQPWLDGINSGDGTIRQFVAVALGSGATVEGQLSGEEIHGGMQLRAVGLSDAALQSWRAEQHRASGRRMSAVAAAPVSAAMGLGAGGRMRQEIYADQRQLADYDEDRSWRVFVHLCSAEQWTTITGELPPPTPIDRETYVKFGLPWFDYYDADADDLAASQALEQVKTVDEVLGLPAEPFSPVDPATVIQLKDAHGDEVSDGDW